MVPALLISLVAASPLRLAKREPVPSFVLANAPLLHLHSTEEYGLSDVAVHLAHVEPQVNYSSVASSVTLQTLSGFGSDVFLTSKDDVTDSPKAEWLRSPYGAPDANGLSGAPATIVLVNKPDGVLDAFFFTFFSFNDGGKVIGIAFGDHVGDWEHTMVRFVNGEPTAYYLSAHSGGSAYTFDAVEKTSGRPTAYIAHGTHANYATADAGPLWDPTLNYRAYWYEPGTGGFTIADGAGAGGAQIEAEGTGWLDFRGRWGDEQYRILEHGNYCVPIGDEEECHYVSGPTGPVDKVLDRTAVCPNADSCTIASSL
ncbi:hypothetical protein C8Q80DRAFT_1264442 [Daedaleopsis nitida]|nr:hypothetical protein C8Q80DRAFT_1264442 [Daedaleopsis nitida]